MRKEMTSEGCIYYIKGESGKEHPFKCREITSYKGDSHIFISDTMTVYIFVKDINSDNPVLISLGYLKKWNVLYKNMKDYAKIIQHKTKNLLFLRLSDDNKGEDIYYDIKYGSDLNRELYDD